MYSTCTFCYGPLGSNTILETFPVARRVAFDPYPFDERPCRVQLCYRTLPQTRFDDLASFRHAYFTAPVAVMEFELV